MTDATVTPLPSWSGDGVEWWQVAWTKTRGETATMDPVDLDALAASWLLSSWVRGPESFDERLSMFLLSRQVAFADDAERQRAFTYIWERHSQVHHGSRVATGPHQR